jgi:hypothetical protein
MGSPVSRYGHANVLAAHATCHRDVAAAPRRRRRLGRPSALLPRHLPAAPPMKGPSRCHFFSFRFLLLDAKNRAASPPLQSFSEPLLRCTSDGARSTRAPPHSRTPFGPGFEA